MTLGKKYIYGFGRNFETTFKTMTDIPEISKVLKDGLYYYNANWLNIKADSNYKAALMKCMSYCKPDMYFNLLCRFIVKFDFVDQSKSIPNDIELERLYLEAALKILKNSALCCLMKMRKIIL